MLNRHNLISLLIGKRRTGKSTFLLELILNHHQKVLIYDTDDNEIYKDIPIMPLENLSRWKRGVYRIVDPDFETVFADIRKHLWNALVVFEDATKYMSTGVPKVISQLMYLSKQRNLDLIFTFHFLRKVYPEFFDNANYITKFKTGEDINQFKHKIMGYEMVKAVHDRVEANSNPYYKETVHVQ